MLFTSLFMLGNSRDDFPTRWASISERCQDRNNISMRMFLQQMLSKASFLGELFFFGPAHWANEVWVFRCKIGFHAKEGKEEKKEKFKKKENVTFTPSMG